MTAVVAVRERTSLDWLLLASVAALAFNTHGSVRPLVAFLVLVAVGFLWPQALRVWWLWAGIAIVQALIQLVGWEGIDDHVIVGTYWALTIAVGFAVGRPERVMRISGRWMVGLIFLFAVSWKLASPEFRDGSFFTLYLLADPRFRVLADLVGGVDQATFQANRALIGSLYQPGTETTQVTLTATSAIRNLASVMTVWGIAIEALVAVSWLVPLASRALAVRHLALLIFCLATYGLVAITGFGSILLVMGMSTTEPGSVWRRVYGTGFVALALWTPLWNLVIG